MITKIKSNLFKNLFKYSFGTLFEKMILMIVFFYIANLFGPEKYGEIAYSISILTLFSILSVLGFDTYGHREISKKNYQTSSIVTNHIIFKILLFFIVELILYFYTKVFEESNQIQLLIMMYSIVIFFDIFNMEWVARGLERYEAVVVAKIFSSIFLILSVFIILNKNSSNLEFIFIFIFLYKALSALIYIKYFRQYLLLDKIDFKYLQTAFKPSVILMASFFMMTIYYHIDKIMLGNFYDKSYVGFYDVAYKIFGIFAIFNTLLWNVFSARISRNENLKEFKTILIWTGILLSVMLFFSSSLILKSFFNEEYLQVEDTLQILSFNILIVFLNTAFVSPMILRNKENRFFKLTMLGAITNILLNFLLIPIYHMNGAALATVFAEMTILIFAFVLQKKDKL